MKKQSLRVFLTSVTKTIFAATLGLLLIVKVNSVQAQSGGNPGPSDPKEQVKYLGTDGNMLMFRVFFDNPEGDKFAVIVRDKDGNNLFQDVYTDKAFDKRFKLPKADDQTVTFIIRSIKDNYSRSFEINSTTRWVEDVVVRKVN